MILFREIYDIVQNLENYTMSQLALVFLVAVVVTITNATPYEYYYSIHLAGGGFHPQEGTFSSLKVKVKDGLLSKSKEKVLVASNNLFDPLIPGKYLKKHVTLDGSGDVLNAQKMKLEWTSSTPNAGPIIVDRIVFMQTQFPKYDSFSLYSEMGQNAKAFCYGDLITAGKEVVFTDCTEGKDYELQSEVSRVYDRLEHK